MKLKLTLYFCMAMFGLITAVSARALTFITDIPPEGFTINESGTYYFAEDIEWEGQEGKYTAITINASDVVLDMNRHSLSAPRNVPLSGTIGISANAVDNLFLRNGTIKGFQLTGVALLASTRATLSDMVIRDIGNGVPGYTPTGLSATLCQDLTLDNVSVRKVNGSWNKSKDSGQIVSGISLISCADVNIGGRISGISGYSSVLSGVFGIFCDGIAFNNLEIDDVNGSGINVSGASFGVSKNINFDKCVVSNLHNDAGVCSGIATDDCQHITVLNTTINKLSTGLMSNENAVGHTCIGMVFAPIRVVEGGVSKINVVNPGEFYSQFLIFLPSVEIDKPQLSSGTQAVGFPVIDSNGELQSVKVLNPGSGYTKAPDVKIVSNPLWPYGTGAEAAAEVSTAVEQGSASDIFVEQCQISDIAGSCDDAHGISLFVVSDATVRGVTVENVTDGRGGRGAKATGIEVYGLVNNQPSNILVENCKVSDISAISPGDLQAAGFSVAGKGVTFRNCEAYNVTVSGANPVDPTSPGYGIGFGWAPDIRPEYTYPALEAVIEDCTASECQVGFDTFYFQDSTLYNIKSFENDVDIKEESIDVVRVFYCDKCSECPDSPEESEENWFKKVPVQNIASRNTIIPYWPLPHR